MEETLPKPQIETIIDPDANYRKNIEVIANPPLPETDVLVSIPTYHNEWKRGIFLRNLHAFLSQQTGDGVTAEINYVLNTGSKTPWKISREYTGQGYYDHKVHYIKSENPDDIEAFDQMDQCRSFLKDVVTVQNIARTNASNPAIAETLSKYTDPIMRNILDLAVQKTKNIAVSAVDMVGVDLWNLGYDSDISGIRTAGRDYAVSRFAGGDGHEIFSLYDCDTVPDSNTMLRDLVTVYDTNPGSQYYFSPMAYQAPGESKAVVSTSSGFIGSKIDIYNLKSAAGSPQISMRIKAAETLKSITGIYEDYFSRHEDIDTAYRLIAHFGDMSQPLLLDTAVSRLPLQLTEDRIGGYMDGRPREEELDEKLKVTFEDQVDAVRKLHEADQAIVMDLIAQIPQEEVKTYLTGEIEKVRAILKQKLAVQLRFNRQVARDMLQIHTILPADPSIPLSEEVQLQILQQPRGKALLFFINRNRYLVSQLNQGDYKSIQYLLDSDSGGEPVELNDFQKSLREYLGDPDSSDTNKRPVLQSLYSDSLAIGHIHQLYTQRVMSYGNGDEKDDHSRAASFKKVRDNYPDRLGKRNKSWTDVVVTKSAVMPARSLSLKGITWKIVNAIVGAKVS